MKKFFILFFFLVFSLNLMAEDDSSTNISFSISPPPIAFADKYYEDESNTETSKTLGFSYMNVSGDMFSLNNISIDFSENYFKSKMGILYSNISIYGGWGEIKNVLDDSKMPMYNLGCLAGFNFQTKLYYSEKLKIFLAPGLDANIGMLTYQIKNYPDINYDTWPPSIVYKDVNCNAYITGVTPKISFQINYKASPQLEVIPFLTCMSDMSVVKVFIENDEFSDSFVYLSLNFGLEAIFFETYQLSSMVKLLNDESKTKIINISFSFPLL